MAKTVQILCDHCGDNLTSTGRMPIYRLHLSSEALPHLSGSIYAVMVYPDIEEDKYFCNLSHLMGWLQASKVKSSEEVEGDG